MELKDQLTALQGEMKTYVEKATEEKKQYGATQAETKSAVEKLQAQLDAIDVKLAAQHVAQAAKPLAETLKENEDVARLIRDKKGHAVFTVPSAAFERKTTITEAAIGTATPGILGYDARSGIVPEVRQNLTLRNRLSSRPTEAAVVSFIKIATPFSVAAMAPETTLKQENAVSFAVAQERVRTVATFVPASRQVLDDFSELSSYIKTNLPFYVELEVEKQIVAGDSTGENLHGLVPQAVVFPKPSGGYPTGQTKIDTIGQALSALAGSLELAPDFIVLNIADWWAIRLTKDNYGRYILGDPQDNVSPSIFGITVLPSVSIAAGTFLIGNSTPVATEVRQRMDMEVAVSTEDRDNFVRNMVTIRAEERLALITYRPNAFMTGSF